MLSFSKRGSHVRSQALLISIILSLTVISCTNKPKPINSISKTSNNTKSVARESLDIDPNQLQLKKPVERELVGGEIHSYTIKLEANQYLNAVVEQKGIDVVAILYNPSNEKIYEIDSPNGTAGPEPIYFISQVSGNYRLEVGSLEKQAKAGNYEVKINDLRTSVADDIDRVAGFKAFGEAILLESEGKRENEKLIINKYKESIEKLDKVGELLAEVYSVSNLARFYEKRGELDYAEPLYIKALELTKKARGDNHPDTAVSTNNLALLYSIKGYYEKAELLYIQALAISKSTLGDNHRETANTMNNLANVYNKIGNYAKAEKIYIEALEINRKILGDSHHITASSMNNLAAFYYNRGDYNKAEPILIESLEIVRKLLGNEHPNTANTMNNLAALYYTKGDYDSAEPLYLQAIAVLKKSLGDNNPGTINSIGNLANLYTTKGEYTKSEALLVETLTIRRKILGEDHPDTANSLSNLARLYDRKGDYEKAEPLHLRALGIRQKQLGDNHPDTPISIDNLASLYMIKGDYKKAESFYLRALNIRKKILGEDNLLIAQSINNLASLYFRKGEFEKAEPLYLQALDIQKKKLGENHPATANLLNNLALLYNKKGDYEKAESLFLQALEFNRKALGENHPFTAQFINNLAALYYAKRNYEKTEPLYLQALDIRKKALGDSHIDTIESTNNLAEFYRTKGDYERAELLYLQALGAHKKVLGEYNALTATSINNLGLLYFSKGEYKEAEPLLLNSLKIRQQVLGLHHSDITNSMYNLSMLYFMVEDYEKAIKYSREGNDMREGELSKNLLLGSERQKKLYLQKYKDETILALSFHIQTLPKNRIARQSALTEVLRRKGRSIDAVNQSVEALRKRSSPEDVELLDKLSEKTAYLSNLTTQGLGKRTPEEYQKLLKSVEEEIEELQYKISERSAEFRTVSKPIMLEDVQKVVPKDATLVEFASYRPYDAKTRVYGAPRYVVYLLNNEGEPDWVDLGLADPIDRLVDSLRVKLSDGKTSVNREIRPLARKLDKLLMQDVRRLVGKGKQLLIAPDGKLNLLPFAALVDETGKFLVENNRISYLTSGRDLLRLEIKIENKQSPVIIGDPDFGPIPDAASINEGSTLYARLGFNRLASTELEAKAIKELFPDGNLLLQEQATEQAINNLNAPLILHIATHGFFLQEEVVAPSTPEQTRIGEIIGVEGENNFSGVKIENPLLRSGIALSGANLHKDEKEEGIFTALKTTGVNLWGTKVVVLSACNTAVGEVKTGDGIYGLRRALVLAGSETQLMSLWPVSDKGTKELMIDYYSRLQKDEGRSDALRNVQLQLLKSSKRSHPFYWASFIQSGEWANLKGVR